MKDARERLIVALDVPSVEEARSLIERLGDAVGIFKIGLELLFAGGTGLARELAERSGKVFVDAKLLDIEATVERATAAIARLGVHLIARPCRRRCGVAAATAN
jgi:orotidine-5'-phosphate decarboxylase